MTPQQTAELAFWQTRWENDLEPGCEEIGHDWRLIGTADDGTTFFKCRKCGEETED
jgi:hypothetical protein